MHTLLNYTVYVYSFPGASELFICPESQNIFLLQYVRSELVAVFLAYMIVSCCLCKKSDPMHMHEEVQRLNWLVIQSDSCACQRLLF